jgi:hypothetical protein
MKNLKIQLFENNFEKVIKPNGMVILTRIVDEIFKTDFGLIYEESEIDYIRFHYKGYPNLEAFYVSIVLNFIESDDVINDIEYRMKKIKSNLAFMSISKSGFFTPYTQFHF